MKTDLLSEYIGLVVLLFLLSMICERLADFLKSFLSEANANDGLGLYLRKWLRIGNLLQKSAPGSISEERRAYRILKINLFCGFFTALFLHADLFSIIEHKSEPFKAIGWGKVKFFFDEGFKWDIGGGLLFLIGCFATGFFISFGSKFWHDLLDLLYNVKNIKRAILDAETYKSDNVQAIEKRVQTFPSSYIHAAHLEAKQKLIDNPNVKAVCLKCDNYGYYLEVSVQQPDPSIGETYVYDLEPGNGQSIRMVTLVLGKDVIRAHTANLSSRIFASGNPDKFGTLGCLVKPTDRFNRKKYILTCCHNFLEPSTDLPYESKRKLQVAVTEEKTIVGTLYRAERDKEMDAALIEIDEAQVDDINNFLPSRGQPKGIRSLYKDDINKAVVVLNGAKSKSQRGKLAGIYCDIKIQYELDEFTLINMLSISNENTTMSQGGDSGSVVMDTENNIIGLVVAGNDQQTFVMPIQVIFQKMNIELLIN